VAATSKQGRAEKLKVMQGVLGEPQEMLLGKYQMLLFVCRGTE
jgi:hypothetical protein